MSCTAPCVSIIHGRHDLLLHIIFQFFLKTTCIFRIAVTWRITCSFGWLVILILIPIWLKDVTIICIRLIFRNVLQLSQQFVRFEVTGSLMKHPDHQPGRNFDSPNRKWYCPVTSSLPDRSLLPTLRRLQKLRPCNSTWDDSYGSGQNHCVWRLKVASSICGTRCGKVWLPRIVDTI
jgi:hypothetical protein